MARDRVGPLLRAAGFTGTAPTWCLRSDAGDFGLVHLQRSRWNTADEVAFDVVVAVVPEPWWRFRTRHVLERPAKTPTVHDALLRLELLPARRYPGWDHPVLRRDGWVVRDHASADRCAAVLAAELTTAVVPELIRMRDREALIATLRDKRSDWQVPSSNRTPRKVAIACLVADDGPGPALAEAINIIRSLPDGGGGIEAHTALLDWLTRAQRLPPH
jgi:hypothetical protein